MRDFEKTTPLVAQAKIAQSKTMNVLLHLHVPEVRGQEKLKSIFTDTLAMRVIVTSANVTNELHKNDLARAAYEFLPRWPLPSNSNQNPEVFGRHQSFSSMIDGRSLKQIEKIVIEEVIASVGGSVPKAARKLKVSPSTLYRKREAWSAD